MTPSEVCSKCGSNNWRNHGNSRECVRCKQFSAMTLNARVKRANTAQPILAITRSEFVAWANESERACYSCGVPEHLIEHLGVSTKAARQLRLLGVDRLDNNGDYALGNIGLACLPCNNAKAGFFSADEIKLVGAGIARVWKARLTAAGVVDPWLEADHV